MRGGRAKNWGRMEDNLAHGSSGSGNEKERTRWQNFYVVFIQLLFLWAGRKISAWTKEKTQTVYCTSLETGDKIIHSSHAISCQFPHQLSILSKFTMKELELCLTSAAGLVFVQKSVIYQVIMSQLVLMLMTGQPHTQTFSYNRKSLFAVQSILRAELK